MVRANRSVHSFLVVSVLSGVLVAACGGGDDQGVTNTEANTGGVTTVNTSPVGGKTGTGGSGTKVGTGGTHATTGGASSVVSTGGAPSPGTGGSANGGATSTAATGGTTGTAGGATSTAATGGTTGTAGGATSTAATGGKANGGATSTAATGGIANGGATSTAATGGKVNGGATSTAATGGKVNGGATSTAATGGIVNGGATSTAATGGKANGGATSTAATGGIVNGGASSTAAATGGTTAAATGGTTAAATGGTTAAATGGTAAAATGGTTAAATGGSAATSTGGSTSLLACTADTSGIDSVGYCRPTTSTVDLPATSIDINNITFTASGTSISIVNDPGNPITSSTSISNLSPFADTDPNCGLVHFDGGTSIRHGIDAEVAGSGTPGTPYTGMSLIVTNTGPTPMTISLILTDRTKNGNRVTRTYDIGPVPNDVSDAGVPQPHTYTLTWTDSPHTDSCELGSDAFNPNTMLGLGFGVIYTGDPTNLSLVVSDISFGTG